MKDKYKDMATIKSYTDIAQSRRLAEILPLESADMTYYACVKDWRGNSVEPKWGKPANLTKEELALPCSNFQVYEYVPCWSLAALLGIVCEVKRMDYSDKWEAASWNKSPTEQEYYVDVEGHDNPVDACVAIIEKLHELKLL